MSDESGDTIESLRAQVVRLQAQLLAVREANTWCESKHCKRTAFGYAEDADGMRWLACAQHGGTAIQELVAESRWAVGEIERLRAEVENQAAVLRNHETWCDR
jgi:hypothetical protein